MSRQLTVTDCMRNLGLDKVDWKEVKQRGKKAAILAAKVATVAVVAGILLTSAVAVGTLAAGAFMTGGGAVLGGIVLVGVAGGLAFSGLAAPVLGADPKLPMYKQTAHNVKDCFEFIKGSIALAATSCAAGAVVGAVIAIVL